MDGYPPDILMDAYETEKCIPNGFIDIDSLEPFIESFVGFNNLTRILASWFCRINTISENKEYLPQTLNDSIEDVITEALCVLLEREFDSNKLRSYMEQENSNKNWKPPNFYWELMQTPITAQTLKRLCFKDCRSEFLLAFSQDLLTFESKKHNWHLSSDFDLSQITGNFTIFCQAFSDVLRNFLFKHEDMELGQYDPDNLSRLLCHTENSYLYAQGLLHFLPKWRSDLMGCYRLSQILYKYAREVRCDTRVADLNYRFAGLMNFPKLYKALMALQQYDLGLQVLNQEDVCALSNAVTTVSNAFEKYQCLLYMVEKTFAKKSNDYNSGIMNEIFESMEADASYCHKPEEAFSHDSYNKYMNILSPSYIVREKFDDASSIGTSTALENSSAEMHLENNMNKEFSLTPASQAGGTGEWKNEYERLRDSPVPFPVSIVRDVTLIDALLSDFTNPQVKLSSTSLSSYVELLVSLMVFSAYEILLHDEIANSISQDRLKNEYDYSNETSYEGSNDYEEDATIDVTYSGNSHIEEQLTKSNIQGNEDPYSSHSELAGQGKTFPFQLYQNSKKAESSYINSSAYSRKTRDSESEIKPVFDTKSLSEKTFSNSIKSQTFQNKSPPYKWQKVTSSKLNIPRSFYNINTQEQNVEKIIESCNSSVSQTSSCPSSSLYDNNSSIQSNQSSSLNNLSLTSKIDNDTNSFVESQFSSMNESKKTSQADSSIYLQPFMLDSGINEGTWSEKDWENERYQSPSTIADKLPEIKSTITSSICYDTNQNKVASYKPNNNTNLFFMRKKFRELNSNINCYREAARRDLFEIYSYIRDPLIMSSTCCLGHLLPLTSTLTGASAVLTYINNQIIFRNKECDPILAITPAVLIAFTFICRRHAKKRSEVLATLFRCFEQSRNYSFIGTQKDVDLVYNEQLQQCKKNVFSLIMWLLGCGSYEGVFAFIKAHMSQMDRSFLRRYFELIVQYCQPPYSIPFASALLQLLHEFIIIQKPLDFTALINNILRKSMLNCFNHILNAWSPDKPSSNVIKNVNLLKSILNNVVES